MTFTVLDIITFVAIVPLFLFAFFFIFLKRKVSEHYLYLGFFLFVLGAFTLNYLIRSKSSLENDIFRLFYYIGSSLYFLLGPLFYAYTKSVFGYDLKFKKELPHYSFFILSIFYFLTVYNDHIMVFYIVRYGQIFVYFLLSLKIVVYMNKEVKNIFSQLPKSQISQFTVVLPIFFILWIIDILALANFLILDFSRMINTILAYISMTFTLLLPYFIIYYSIKYSKEIEVSDLKSEVRQTGPEIPDNELDNYVDRLYKYLRSDKPYLNPNLTIKDLAVSLEVPPRLLSEIINKKLEKTFFDLINGLRTEEAKNLISQQDGKNILEICYNSGFNSKSAFNNAFKKYAGQTPSDFKNSLG